MKKRQSIPGGTWYQRGLNPAILYLRAELARKRKLNSNRFAKTYAWLRIVTLGIILMYFSAFSFGNAWHLLSVQQHLPGMGAIGGGILIAIVLSRLAQPSVYWDWISSSVLLVGIGVLIYNDPRLLHDMSVLLFCLGLTALGVLRIFIGATHHGENGGHALIASGWVSVLGVIWCVTSKAMTGVIEAEIIIATDLLMNAAATVAIGVSLRSDKRAL